MNDAIKDRWEDGPTPEQRAFLEMLRRIIRDHIDYITTLSERRMDEALYEAVVKYDDFRTSAMRNLLQKYIDLSSVTISPPFVLSVDGLSRDDLTILAKLL